MERLLRNVVVVPMLDDGLAVRAARNFRAFRNRGVTVGKRVDPVIGTFCIERGVPLLHHDRDFDPMERFLGLAVVRV